MKVLYVVASLESTCVDEAVLVSLRLHVLLGMTLAEQCS